MRAAAEAAGPEMVRVWDPLVRVLHWTLAAAVLGAYAIEHPEDLHEALGYLALGVVALRVVWGLVGTRHARFTDFVPAPATVLDHVRRMLAGRDERHLGHNPAGAVMILVLLSLVTLTGVTGWMMETDALFGADWIEDVHEAIATATIALVPLHVAGVIFASLRHRENLVRAMITGDKRG